MKLTRSPFFVIDVDPRKLAHCRECCTPMYCIYDWKLRDACWECTEALKLNSPSCGFPHAAKKSKGQ